MQTSWLTGFSSFSPFNVQFQCLLATIVSFFLFFTIVSDKTAINNITAYLYIWYVVFLWLFSRFFLHLWLSAICIWGCFTAASCHFHSVDSIQWIFHFDCDFLWFPVTFFFSLAFWGRVLYDLVVSWDFGLILDLIPYFFLEIPT